MRHDSQRCHLQTGELLFRTGDPGHEAYLIESGTIEIFLERADGNSVVARLGPDDLFGEMALVGDQTRTASARAIEPTDLIVITHGMLGEQMSRAAPVLRHLLRVTLNRCRDSLHWLQNSDADVQPATGPDANVPEAQDRDLAITRLRTEQRLREALRQNELELHFQPIVRLESGRTAGFEALLRWRRPDGTLVPPGEFIWVAEDSDLIVEIGRWIIDEAAASLQRFNKARAFADDERPFCSINLSPRQFEDPGLFSAIASALQRHDLQARQLRLEITESMILTNFEAARALLERCRALGCPLLIDDFGTGYSSLSYLYQLPVDALKLDRAFVIDAEDEPRAAVVIGVIAELAAQLGMYSVIEGIESQSQLEICRQRGVDYGQGYLFSKPLPFDAAMAVLRNGD